MSLLGLDAKFYYSTTPLSTTPAATAVWIEVSNIKDVEINLEKSEADTSTRANSGFRTRRFGLKDGGITFEMNWEPGDTAFDAISDAFFNNTTLAMFASDGDEGTIGSQGLTADFDIMNFSRKEPLEGVLTASVTVKPSATVNWYTVAA